MTQSKHPNPLNKVLDTSAVMSLEHKLLNRFNILTFLDEAGIEWAKVAIDPEDERYWNPIAYLACYNNPQG